MFKALLVWVTVLFLRSWGIRTDKTKLAGHGRRYSPPETVRIERRMEVIVPVLPKRRGAVVLPGVDTQGAARSASRPPSQESAEERHLFYPNPGRQSPAVLEGPAHSRENKRPMLISLPEKGEIMYSQTKGVKRSPNSVVLYGRRGSSVQLMTR
ncbi:MAG: hypothetical protein HQL88_01815 [Magnetococcales bacterium]|nr:hypothetical protein [Magnetococcales bacterium]